MINSLFTIANHLNGIKAFIRTDVSFFLDEHRLGSRENASVSLDSSRPQNQLQVYFNSCSDAAFFELQLPRFISIFFFKFEFHQFWEICVLPNSKFLMIFLPGRSANSKISNFKFGPNNAF
jgi:hypothetical protein